MKNNSLFILNRNHLEVFGHLGIFFNLLAYRSDSIQPNTNYELNPEVVLTVFITNAYNARIQHEDQHYSG